MFTFIKVEIYHLKAWLTLPCLAWLAVVYIKHIYQNVFHSDLEYLFMFMTYDYVNDQEVLKNQMHHTNMEILGCERKADGCRVTIKILWGPHLFLLATNSDSYFIYHWDPATFILFWGWNEGGRLVRVYSHASASVKFSTKIENKIISWESSLETTGTSVACCQNPTGDIFSKCLQKS